MTKPEIDLAELRNAAMGAMQRSEAIGEESWYDGSDLYVCSSDGLMNNADAVFISKASPRAIIALLDLLESRDRQISDLQRELSVEKNTNTINTKMICELNAKIEGDMR